jgi:hypothetical protein
VATPEFQVDVYGSFGAFIHLPPNVTFRMTRDIEDGEGETDIFANTLVDDVRYFFDAETNVRGATHYKLYTTTNGVESHDPEDSITIHPDQTVSWNPINDPNLYRASKPKDALILFLSARLAQLTAIPGTDLNLTVKKENHRIRYPVSRGHAFTDADFPNLSVEYASGAGGPAGIGWLATEHGLQMQVEVISGSIPERDAVTDAVRELIPEIDIFLENLGCYFSKYGNFRQYPIEKDANFLYAAALTIATTAYTLVNRVKDDMSWTLLQPLSVKPIDPDQAFIYADFDPDTAPNALNFYAQLSNDFPAPPK